MRLYLVCLSIVLILIIGCSVEKEEPSPQIQESSLSFVDTQALHLAIDAEYKLLTIVDFSLKYGSPFEANMLSQKSTNVQSLSDVFANNRVAVPDNPWKNTDFDLESKSSACEEAVDAQVAAIETYANLRTRAISQELQALFSSLEGIAQNNLVFFRSC